MRSEKMISLIALFKRLNDCDEDTKTQVSRQVPVGPVTRARAKRFKEELNSLVHKVLKQEETVVNIEGEQRLVLLIKVD